jgi:hypothetical protein
MAALDKQTIHGGPFLLQIQSVVNKPLTVARIHARSFRDQATRLASSGIGSQVTFIAKIAAVKSADRIVWDWESKDSIGVDGGETFVNLGVDNSGETLLALKRIVVARGELIDFVVDK